MSKNVFANGKEVSAKKDANESSAALPNVCLSPPSPPAGPVPLPHPNSAKASDTSDGSKTVKIGGAEVGLKNSSNYKKSTGDEPATKSLGMGVITHTIQGKMKHAAWSMDVIFEGKNAIRHMDLTTHNHMNPDDGALTMDKAAEIEPPTEETCRGLKVRADNEDDKIKKGIEKKKFKTVRKGQKYRVHKRGRPRTRKKTITAEQKKKAALDAHKATTVSASKAECGGKTKFTNGYSSSSKLPAQHKQNVAQGIKKGEDSNLCQKDKKDFKHAEDSRTSSCQHTEGKFIEDLFKQNADQKGKVKNCQLTMSIKWKQRKRTEKGWRATEPEQIPCDNCEKTICRASFCGMDIFICLDGKPEKPNFCKKHGYNSADGKK